MRIGIKGAKYVALELDLVAVCQTGWNGKVRGKNINTKLNISTSFFLLKLHKKKCLIYIFRNRDGIENQLKMKLVFLSQHFLFFYLQYCEFQPFYDKCKEWLKTHLPDEFEKLNIAGTGTVLCKIYFG